MRTGVSGIRICCESEANRLCRYKESVLGEEEKSKGSGKRLGLSYWKNIEVDIDGEGESSWRSRFWSCR